MPRTFKHFFSTDSHKAIKARDYGYLNAINYMAPAASAGVGNLCPHASNGCLALCLGWYSGQAGMLADQEHGTNPVRESRKAKARMFMKDRKAFMAEMIAGLKQAKRQADRLELKLCVRLNGSSDIAWEGVRIDECARNVFTLFPYVQFVDYTKNFKRMLAFLSGKMPANYHLTFSRSETNEADCLRVLALGGTVAIPFAGPMPEKWNGYAVVDGDSHDLRHTDPSGVVIGLLPKGLKAKRDTSGFVVPAIVANGKEEA